MVGRDEGRTFLGNGVSGRLGGLVTGKLGRIHSLRLEVYFLIIIMGMDQNEVKNEHSKSYRRIKKTYINNWSYRSYSKISYSDSGLFIYSTLQFLQ